MRARLAIAVSGQSCELREVVLRDKPEALLQASAKGTVPVLVLPDGTVIDESLDIMRWALQRHDPSGWLFGDAATTDRIAGCDGPFKHHLDRYKYPNRYQLPNGTADRDQGAVFLLQLEAVLREQVFLHGTHFGLADAAIAPFVRQYAHTDPIWFAAQPWPRLLNWLTHFESSALFAIAMHKFETWTPESLWVRYPAETGNNL
jgi:glutathione S-transferase